MLENRFQNCGVSLLCKFFVAPFVGRPAVYSILLHLDRCFQERVAEVVYGFFVTCEYEL